MLLWWHVWRLSAWLSSFRQVGVPLMNGGDSVGDLYHCLSKRFARAEFQFDSKANRASLTLNACIAARLDSVLP